MAGCRVNWMGCGKSRKAGRGRAARLRWTVNVNVGPI